ncbi:WD40 repeat domain-containing protein [Pseudoalteromonas luteoviolacea]|uniref:Uncharacterized protein n=1 Tax=Pseudoalteromonas luteoviolacea S4054 TaxID=1129367 RepID=A0A0F6A5P1_9GAMM|nr:WD40 repeat domain-containing protein [Pseudoalteromonas luteoviolacea]AOT10467.1 hypothetical protein S4054249_21600 [Pseudoalteromonas luteoviolacea]AOT15464.1 hypothetical protein S40542_21995 [Pseudoalteromonas luteoviolacea]AOT20286.1 hypothetical protein S4054_21515 [Pseudoalteromonas luteoviolacea]KKE81413.1 hypothetical protein N479_02725 [Pseudoalteromonas luteoviolacea S4054]KZN71690.1 hypothetical protein N481_18655 [Pseudoalteromonas luteoviolacea S4047-1]
MCKSIIHILSTAVLVTLLLGCDGLSENPKRAFHQVSEVPIDLGVFSSHADLVAFVAQGKLNIAKTNGGGVLAHFKLNEAKVTDIAISQDNRLLAASFATYVVVWDLVDNVRLGQFDVAGESEFAKTSKVAIYANPMKLLVGMTDGTISVIDFENKLTKRIKYHDARVSFLKLGAQRQLILSAGHDGVVNIINARTLQPTFEHRLSKRVTSVAYNLSQNLLFASDALNEQIILRPFSSEEEFIGLAYRERFRWFRAAAFSPDGQYLATGSSKSWWTLWDVKTGQEIDAYGIQAATSTALIVDMHINDESKLVTLNSDGIVEYWDINTLTGLRK